MLYILFGSDAYSRDQEVLRIKNELGDPEVMAGNISTLDGEKLTLNQLKDVCSTYPLLLCPNRLVIVDNLLIRFESNAGSEKRNTQKKVRESSRLKEWQGLVDYIQKEMPPTTVLIFTEGKITEKNSLFKALMPLATVKPFPQLNNENLRKWIRNRVIERGSSISSSAVGLLVELIGGELWVMSNEIDKLISYCAGREIADDDVRRLTGYSREVSIFALVDSVLEGKRKVAQQLLHRLLQEGFSSLYILNMIVRQLRFIVRTKDLSRRVPRAQIKNRLGIPSEYAMEQTIKQANNYTITELIKAYHIVLETDMAIKTGKYDDDLAINLLVAELCPA